MWADWINQIPATLPGCNDALFKNVWRKKKLLFDNKVNIADIIDYYSAYLAAATLRSKKQVLICLPDLKQHRPAFLLATALIRDFLDSYSQKSISQSQIGPILYFGASIGIREQLCRTSIQGLGINFAQVFSQHDIQRGATDINSLTRDNKSKIKNQKVVTIYSPADPVEIIKTSSPSWIAVDCGDAKGLPWLYPLLEEASKNGIPVIAWCQNPLSECITAFESVGSTFIWPANLQPSLANDLSSLLSSYARIKIQPILIYGNETDQFCKLMKEIRYNLMQLTQSTQDKGRFICDTLEVHWKCYSSLESLVVPLDFYEAEASKFWGIQSIKKLTSICSSFRNDLKERNDSLFMGLEHIGVLIERAYSLIENNGCALWESCIDFCLEDQLNDGVRLLIFSSESKKKIFLYALLAKYNTTEDELHQFSIWTVSLKELQRYYTYHFNKHDEDINWSHINPFYENRKIYPTLVGLPSSIVTPRLYYVFLNSEINIIMYPHQYSAFSRRKMEWSSLLGGNIKRNASTFAYLSELDDISKDIPVKDRIDILEPQEINIETTKKTHMQNSSSIWEPEDSVVEGDQLFKNSSDDNEEFVHTDQLESTKTVPSDKESALCLETIKITFDHGWYAYFAPDDLLNVITKKGLDLRYTRSLSLNDRVLIIHGQQKQNLYDLIISRVHKHPSIELHIALINRWQEDLYDAYERWCLQPITQKEINTYGNHDIDGLLKRMQEQGSQRNSCQTLSNWIKGYILCPIQQEDIMRIAGILNMGFEKQYYKLIYKAANRIRGLHRGLSNKLNRWLQEQASGTIQKYGDDIIDSELGLTFEDIRNSLLILQIENVETLHGPFLRSSLGRIEKEA